MGLFGKGAKRRSKRRAARKEARRDARQERIETRHATRRLGQEHRALTKQTAYENGVNPNQFISDGFEAAADVGSAYFESLTPSLPGGNGGSDKKNANQTTKGGDGLGDMMPLLLGAGALLLLKK